MTRERASARRFRKCLSALTGGNLSLRLDADAAVRTLENLAKDLDFVDLTAQETLQALKQARRRGVRGGRVHDFLDAVAAERSGVAELLTIDENDFEPLTDAVKAEQV